jgi:hypothetical protein
MKHLVLVVALAAFSTSAFAYQSEKELRLVRDISVFIEEEVTDGCLSNPDALKVEAELILRRSGVKVSNRGPFGENYMLQINALGWEQNGRCVTTLSLELWRFAKPPEGHSALIIAYDQSALLAGYGKTEMQDRLRNAVSEFVSDLANEILKAQGN